MAAFAVARGGWPGSGCRVGVSTVSPCCLQSALHGDLCHLCKGRWWGGRKMLERKTGLGSSTPKEDRIGVPAFAGGEDPPC